MNTLTEHDRKLAETLKSLSLDMSADQPKRRGKTIVRMVGILLLLSATLVAAAFVSPALVNDLKATLMGQSEPVKPNEANQQATVRATSDRDDLSPTPKPSEAASREITGSGYVVAPRSTIVFAKYEGTITAMAVDAGDRVKASQTLAVIEDINAHMALEQAKAGKVSAKLALASREIALAHSSAALKRTEALAQRNATPKKDLEDAETARKNAQNAVEQGRQDIVRADIALRMAEERVDALTIRAPFDGTVTEVNAHVGDTVLARADSIRESQSILALADMTDMVIDADIAETNLALLQPGMHGEAVLDGFPGMPFRIALERIAPVASAEKGTIALRLALIDPPAGIRPNMAARIRLIVPKIQDHPGEVSP